MRSGKWVQTDREGNEQPFEAIATMLKGEPVLLVQQIYESYSEIEEILQNVRENTISREKIEYLDYRDEQTGLYNRRAFMLLAKEQMLIAGRNKKPVTLVSIDLDGLKKINDEYGHQIGDLAIVNAALLFKRIFRQKDILGRIGGDEFLILAINMNSTEADSFAIRLDRGVSEWNEYKQQGLKLSFSIGLASSDAKEISLEQLFQEADAKMYANKQNKYQYEKGYAENQIGYVA